MKHRLLSKKYLPFIAAISVTLSAFDVFVHLGVLEKERYRASVISKSAVVNERLEKTIIAAHTLSRWMIAYVSLHPDFKNSDFERIAKEIIAHDRNIRHLALAKDNVITHIYPLKGNETALGLEYLEHPEQRASVLKAIETKDTVVAGPVSLVQGGTGFIIRTPIYLEPNGTSIANRQYWGLASVVVDTDTLFKEAGLFSEKELKFAMRGKDGAGADGDVFFGDKAVFRSDPVITDVILPVGSWQLAAMPKAGWSLAATPLWLKAVRLTIVLLLGSLTFHFFSSHQNILKSEERFRTLYESSRDAVMTLTPDQGFLGGNPAAVALFGCRDEKGFTALSPTSSSPEFQSDGRRSAEKAQEMMRLAFERGSHFFEWTHRRVDGTEFFADVLLTRMDVGGKKLLQATVRDITARKKMEAELAKKGKLESIGILAGGIAHDFNNLLTGILGNISLTKIRMRTYNKDYSLLSEAENTCMQMSELTRKLITFSDGGSPFRKAASISSIINEKECSELCGPEISCRCEIPQGLSPLYVDDWQIRQVFKNMVINAKEAMPEGGVIRVRAENIVLDKGDGVLKEGRYVMITIKDSGKGIPKDILPKIFDPYFTTKEMGAQKGMGLGLAVCYSIVKKHKGHIAVESMRGEGTTFYVYLPAAEIEIKD